MIFNLLLAFVLPLMAQQGITGGGAVTGANAADQNRIDAIDTNVSSLLSGRPTITGQPTYQNGICFKDSSCQTSASSGTVSGNNGYIAKFGGASTVQNTATPIYENSGLIGIGTTNPNALLHVAGSVGIKGPEPWFSPTAFGAKCDNSTDDTTALINTFAAASAQTNNLGQQARVYLPGMCVLKSTITIAGNGYIGIFGCGMQACGINWKGPSGSDIFQYLGSGSFHFYDFQIINGGGSNKNTAFQIGYSTGGNNIAEGDMGFILTTNIDYGIHAWDEADNVMVYHFWHFAGQTGIWLDSTGVASESGWTIDGLRCQGDIAPCIITASGAGITIKDMKVNTTTATAQGIVTGKMASITIINPYFECDATNGACGSNGTLPAIDIGTYTYAASATGGAKIQNGIINMNHGTNAIGIRFNYSIGNTADGTSFVNVATGVYITANATGTFITNMVWGQGNGQKVVNNGSSTFLIDLSGAGQNNLICAGNACGQIYGGTGGIFVAGGENIVNGVSSYTNGSPEGANINSGDDSTNNFFNTVDLIAGRTSTAGTGGSHIRVFVQPQTTGNPKQALEISSSAFVGVNVSTPATPLDVNGAAQFGSVSKSTFNSSGALTLASGSALNLSGSGGFVTNSSSINASAFFGNGANLTALSPGNISSGAAGSGVIISSLAVNGVSTGTYGNSSIIPGITIASNGLITKVSSNTISISNSNLQSGSYSSITGVGTLGSLTVNGVTQLNVTSFSSADVNIKTSLGSGVRITTNTATGNDFNIVSQGNNSIWSLTDWNTATKGIFLNFNANSIGLGTSSGTQIYRCSGGTDAGWILYGNSGAAQTLCTGGGGSLVATGVFLP